MDRRIPPPGVKLVASNDRNLKVIVKLRIPIAQTSPTNPPLSEGGVLTTEGGGAVPRRVPHRSGGDSGAQ